MAACRKIFRIEEMAGAPLKPRADDSRAPAHSDITEELSALRDTSLTRPGESDRLAGRIVHRPRHPRPDRKKCSERNGMQPPPAQIVCELEAVMQGRVHAAQNILAAAEDIVAAANNLSAGLEDT
jgi:hypothetical protein